MPANQLVAINAITHKPGTEVENVEPGAIFAPKDEAERAFFLQAKAARELTEAESGESTPAAKTSAKNKTTKKPEVPVADTTKAVVLDQNPGNDDPGQDLLS